MPPSKRIQPTIKKDALAPGKIIAGKYRYIKTLGSGGMGQVHLVADMETSQKLAMKCCLDAHAQRFEREVHSWLRLGRHPNVVSAIYFDWVDGIPSLFIEYVDGGNLEEVIKKSQDDKKEIPAEIVFDYSIQICRGMAHLHKSGIIHRDLKPSNILISTETSGPGVLKITDMGLSKFKGWNEINIEEKPTSSQKTAVIQPQITRTCDMLGTPQYMSPEQYESSKGVGEDTDIYAFGLIMYELLTQGKKPFDTPDDFHGWLYAHTYEAPKHIKNHATSRFSFFQRKGRNILYDLIMQCLSKKPEDRPQSFIELEEKLKNIYQQLFSREYDDERENIPSTISPEDINNQAVSLLEMGGLYAEEGAKKLDKLCSVKSNCIAVYVNRLLFQLKSHQISLKEFWQACQQFNNEESCRAKLVEILLGAALEQGSYLEQSLQLLEQSQLAWSPALLRLHAKWRYCAGDYNKAVGLFQNLCRSSVAIAEDFYHYAGALVEQAIQNGRGRIVLEKNMYSLLLEQTVKQQVSEVLKQGQQKCGAGLWLREAQDHLMGNSCEKISFWHEHVILRGHTKPVRSVAITSDHRLVISGSDDETVRIWDVEKQQTIAVWEHHHDPITAVAISPDGQIAISGSRNGTLCFWDIKSIKLLWQTHCKSTILAISIPADNATAWVSDADGHVILWNLAQIIKRSALWGWLQSQQIKQLDTEHGAALKICASLDNKYLIAGTRDHSVLLWCLDKDNTKPPILISHPDAEIRQVRISGDNRVAITVTDATQNNVFLWDIVTGNKLVSFTGISNAIQAMTIANNGRLVFLSHSGMITIWDLQQRDKIAYLEGQDTEILDLAAPADANLVISAGSDGSLRIWKNSFAWPILAQQHYWKIVPETLTKKEP